MSDFFAESFTNHIGQTINPGDKVVFISNSYKTISVKKGLFRGVFKGNVRRSVQVFNEDGTPQMEVHPHNPNYTYPKRTLITEYATKSVSVGKVYRGKKWDSTTRKLTDEDVFGTSTLLKSRVYLEDTPLENIVGTLF